MGERQNIRATRNLSAEDLVACRAIGIQEQNRLNEIFHINPQTSIA